MLACYSIYDETANKKKLYFQLPLEYAVFDGLVFMCARRLFELQIQWEKKMCIVDVFILCNNLARFNVTRKNNGQKKNVRDVIQKKAEEKSNRVYSRSNDWSKELAPSALNWIDLKKISTCQWSSR